MERNIMENKTLETYIEPRMEILEVQLIQMLAQSPSLDVDTETDGDAETNRYRRGSWGNLWE